MTFPSLTDSYANTHFPRGCKQTFSFRLDMTLQDKTASNNEPLGLNTKCECILAV